MTHITCTSDCEELCYVVNNNEVEVVKKAFEILGYRVTCELMPDEVDF